MDNFNLRYFKPSSFILLCAILTLGLFFANNYIKNHWGVSASVFGILTLIFTLINRYLWNKKPFIWLYYISDFSGKYEGFITYEYKNENCEKITGQLEHTKEIIQNGSDVIINSLTKDKDSKISSRSTSLEASIVKMKDGSFSIIYNYRNEGNSELGFSPYYGTEVLRVLETENKKHLVGSYYTERLPYQTKGKIDLEFINNKTNNKK